MKIVPRVALVVGDTAGHTHPALAVAEALRARESGAQVVFLGPADSVAASIVARAGESFDPVPGSPIRRADLVGLARAGWRTARAAAIARNRLAAHRSQLVLGFGGHATGGVLLAARTLGLSTAILEANVEFGLANRWLRPWVDHVFQGLAAPGQTVVGVPVRPALAALRDTPRRPPHHVLRVLALSGSRGSHVLAERVVEVLQRLVSHGIRVEVRQQAPAPAELRDRYRSLGIEATVDPFIEDVAGAYASADVAIARAGANTIAELAVARLPAVLIPLADASADHQAANAALWEAAGAGPAVREHDWHPDAIASWLRTLATDESSWCAGSRAAGTLARPDAAAHVVDECVRLIQRSM